MKKIFWGTVMLFVVVSAAPLYADAVDDALPVDASERLKASTREVIQAGVDEQDAVSTTRTMIQNRFSERNVVEAQQIIRKARQENLPVAPVVNKIHEGISKKVAPENILQAMEKIRARYAYAYEHARQLSSDEKQVQKMGGLLAQGMTAGLGAGDAERIMAALGTRTRQLDRQQGDALCEQTLLLTREMMRLGTSSEDGARMVGNALQNSYSARDLETIRKTFRRQARFQTPDTLAKRYAQQIQKGAHAGNIGGSGAASSAKGSGRSGQSSGSGSGGGGAGSGGSPGGSAGSGGSGSSGGSGNSGGSGGSAGSGAGGHGK